MGMTAAELSHRMSSAELTERLALQSLHFKEVKAAKEAAAR